jgi:transcriptional regulator with XRE-family HTH domain
MNIKETIGTRIKTCRKACGLTTKELAEKIGTLTSSRISNWEQGTRAPGPIEAKLLAEQLKVSASYLLGLTDNLQGELSHNAENGMRHVPLLSLMDAPYVQEILGSNDLSREKTIVVDHFNSSLDSKILFAMIVEDSSMQPEFEVGGMVIVDGDKNPKPGDYVLVHLQAKNQVILRKYSEAEGCLFQLIPSNDLWAIITAKEEGEARCLGVVAEFRKYHYGSQ